MICSDLLSTNAFTHTFITTGGWTHSNSCLKTIQHYKFTQLQVEPFKYIVKVFILLYFLSHSRIFHHF